MISRNQIAEWKENPVTQVLHRLCEDELNSAVDRPVSDSLVRAEPQLTQENLLENTTKIHEWSSFVEILDGNLEDLDHLEQFSNLVEGYDEQAESGTE